MQAIAHNLDLAQQRNSQASSLTFALSCLSLCLIAAVLISWKPLQLSIATVFLFAGPHNWMEFRYFVARMPVRWGRSKLFFSVGLSGVAALTAAYSVLSALGESWYLTETAWTFGAAIWNTAMVMWLCALVHLRGRQVDRRDWSWVFAVGFALCAVIWLAPFAFSLGLVYLHPLIALWFLDRQLKRKRPQWRKTYHLCLALLPWMLVVMWARLSASPNLPDGDSLSWRIAQHAGAGILTGFSTHMLVATHVFLETVHYGVWLVLIPLVGLGSAPWQVDKIPLASHRIGWPRSLRAALLFGAFAVLVLWACFALDYSTTRDIYFTVAMAHVLAEAPFLIRLF